MEIKVFRGVGWVPQKSADFGPTAPALNHLRSRYSTKKNPFGAIFVAFGDTKKSCTFSGLELAPKSRKKLIGALRCMHKGPKCIQTFWDHPKKFLLCKSTKKSRYVRSLGKNPILRYSQRLKKLISALSCMHKSAKCVQTLWYNLKKFLLCKSTKKAPYVRSFGKKTHFGAFAEAKKGVARAQVR